MEPLIQKSLSNPESDAKIVNAACDLVDSLRGARVAPEITSKIILLQKAIETGISSPEKTIEVIKILQGKCRDEICQCTKECKSWAYNQK